MREVHIRFVISSPEIHHKLQENVNVLMFSDYGTSGDHNAMQRNDINDF